MIETGIDYLHSSKYEQTISTSSRSERNAIKKRLDKYGWDYELDDYDIGGEWDSAIFHVDYEALRRPHMLIATRQQ